jgi:hypothetical protein
MLSGEGEWREAGREVEEERQGGEGMQGIQRMK